MGLSNNDPLVRKLRNTVLPIIKATNAVFGSKVQLNFLTSKKSLATNSLGELIAGTYEQTLTDTTAARTFALTDAGTIVSNTGTTNRTFTVPPNADVAFPIGTIIYVTQQNTGTVTLAGGDGVTVNKLSTKSLVLAGRYAHVTLVKRATNEWHAFGDLTVS